MSAFHTAVEPALRRVFVGRTGELAGLHAALRRAADGRPGMVVVAGEAGVGKSRLIEQFADQAGQAGAVVAVGGAAPLTGGRCRTRRWSRRCGRWPRTGGRPAPRRSGSSYPGCWPG